MTRRVASYARAVQWIALTPVNDDTEWLDDPNGSISVSAALVADIFGRADEEIIKDLRRERQKLHADGQL